MLLPTITLLSPVSPIAWLPIAIFLFGIGNAPAIFMVVVALFFHMVLATISQIDGVNRNLINVARTMGATKWQIYRRRDHPGDPARAADGAADEPVRRLDGGAVAETTGVGYGMGQVIMLASATRSIHRWCSSRIALIGVLGFVFDLAASPRPEAHPVLGARDNGGAAWSLTQALFVE